MPCTVDVVRYAEPTWAKQVIASRCWAGQVRAAGSLAHSHKQQRRPRADFALGTLPSSLWLGLRPRRWRARWLRWWWWWARSGWWRRWRRCWWWHWAAPGACAHRSECEVVVVRLWLGFGAVARKGRSRGIVGARVADELDVSRPRVGVKCYCHTLVALIDNKPKLQGVRVRACVRACVSESVRACARSPACGTVRV
jgi:hypothetical protein